MSPWVNVFAYLGAMTALTVACEGLRAVLERKQARRWKKETDARARQNT